MNLKSASILVFVFACACGKNRVNEPVKSWEFVPVEQEENTEPKYEYHGAADDAVAETLPRMRTACDVWEYRMLFHSLSSLPYNGETTVEIPVLNASFECFFIPAVSTRSELRTWYFDEFAFSCTSGQIGIYIRENPLDTALAAFNEASTRPQRIEILFNGEPRDFRISNSTWEILGQNCEGGNSDENVVRNFRDSVHRLRGRA